MKQRSVFRLGGLTSVKIEDSPSPGKIKGSPPPVNIELANPSNPTTIYISLRETQGDASTWSYYPISGFPRCLVKEDYENGMFDQANDVLRVDIF